MRPATPPTVREPIAEAASHGCGRSTDTDHIIQLSEKAMVAREAVRAANISQDPAQMRRALLLIEESALEQELAAIDLAQAAREQIRQAEASERSRRPRRNKKPSGCDMCMAVC